MFKVGTGGWWVGLVRGVLEEWGGVRVALDMVGWRVSVL